MLDGLVFHKVNFTVYPVIFNRQLKSKAYYLGLRDALRIESTCIKRSSASGSLVPR